MTTLALRFRDGDPVLDGVALEVSRPVEALELSVDRTVEEADGDVAITLAAADGDTTVEAYLDERDAAALREALAGTTSDVEKADPI
jgi:hypothetical protein